MSRVAEAFADAVRAMHARLGGAPHAGAAVATWAGAAWNASADGHVCVEVTDEEGLASLRASPVVAIEGGCGTSMPDASARAGDPAGAASPAARGGSAVPLVLDGGSLYLRRLWLAEASLASAIAGLDRETPVAGDGAIGRELERLFPDGVADDAQRSAARAALTRRLAVISGGPGTGKTTTLARLLVAFVRLRPAARVCFAAPTGKAAARLAQSLASQLPALDPDGDAARRLPTSGYTVHRLLGLGAAGLDRPAGAGLPLPWDLVIVDEASMLDVELASRLAAAIPPEGRLVLAGDADQLASVEAGAVFSELCAAGLGGAVRLARNYRQADAPGLVALAAALRAQDADAAAAAAEPFVPGGVADAATIAADALQRYADALDAARAGPADEAAAARAIERFEAFRVLAAMRDGPLGVVAINRAIAALARRRVQAPPQAEWYPGRLVMVVRNEPDLGLFNGDVGVCLPPESPSHAPPSVAVPSVAFATGGQGVRRVPILQMPACEDAFAMTVHKSQGSEFGAVSLVPAPSGHALNTRELVYTGVTRARSGLCVWAGADALAQAAQRPTVRHGRLGQRLRTAAEAAARAATGRAASPP